MDVPLSCEQCEALLPGYVLTTLASDEAAAVAEHLLTCDRCPGSLQAYQAVVDQMADVVPVQTPAPEVWQRLRETIDSELATPIQDSAARQRRPYRERAPRWVFGLATVQILLLIGTGWLAWTIWASAVVARPVQEAMQQQLDVYRNIMVLLTAPDARRVVMRSKAAEAQGILLLQPTETTAALVALDFPPLRPNRVYQLWLLRDNQRDNGGTFEVDQDGYAMVTVTAPQPLSAYQAAGITEEPASGSVGPTTPRLIGSPL